MPDLANLPKHKFSNQLIYAKSHSEPLTSHPEIPESPEEHSDDLLRTVREQTLKLKLSVSPSVLDPEGDNDESSVVHFKKIVSTLITQNQQLRQTQQEVMKREEELKDQITKSQRSIENKLNRITDALEEIAVRAKPVVRKKRD